MYMKEDGKMTKLTDMGSICMQMEQPILANGSKINSKVEELKLGLTERGTKENTSMAKNTDKAA